MLRILPSVNSAFDRYRTGISFSHTAVTMDSVVAVNGEAWLNKEFAALNAEVTHDVCGLFKNPFTDVDAVFDYSVPAKAVSFAVAGGAGHLTFIDTAFADDAAESILFV